MEGSVAGERFPMLEELAEPPDVPKTINTGQTLATLTIPERGGDFC